jgi:hypothetical protein
MLIRIPKSQEKTLCRTVALLLFGSLIVSCADTGGEVRPRRQITECPPGMVLICTSRQAPSEGGDEEIPLYDHCYCRSII